MMVQVLEFSLKRQKRRFIQCVNSLLKLLDLGKKRCTFADFWYGKGMHKIAFRPGVPRSWIVNVVVTWWKGKSGYLYRNGGNFFLWNQWKMW
jgi:hypothetical protein